MSDGPSRRALSAALLALFVAAVAVSVRAGPLGRGGNAVWPFNRSWWMFHQESGRYVHLRLVALFTDGRRDEVSLDRWFTFPASRATRRYDELPRDRDTMTALLRWACAKHNREAPASERWSALSVSDTSWPQTRGRRVPFESVPYASRRETDIVFEEPCR